jgi:hypothetical protein
LDYNILNEPDRAHADRTFENNTANTYYCDRLDTSWFTKRIKPSPRWVGSSWYRFLEPAGLKMAESPPGMKHCNTQAAGWISEHHPESAGESKDVKFCFHWERECQDSITGKVTNCGTYYVYFLKETPSCANRYCAG